LSHDQAIARFQKLSQLSDMQALALEAGACELVESLTGELERTLSELMMADMEDIADRLHHGDEALWREVMALRRRIDRSLAILGLVREKLARKRSHLAALGVEWYGQERPLISTDARLNLQA